MRYPDRVNAGRRLAEHLAHHRGLDPLVLGIPRGGVVVGAEVARALDGVLDVVVARKIGAPMAPELAVGAVAADGVPSVDAELVRRLGISDEELLAAGRYAAAEVRRRLAEYRGTDAAPEVAGRVVIVVDDGVATGATLRAALRYLRGLGPGRLVCAIPVGPPGTVDELIDEADEVVCPVQPDRFRAVGEWYDDFVQVTDAQVRSCLEETM